MVNINTDASLHVVIDEVCKHIYTIILCVCVHIQESSSLVDSYLSRTYKVRDGIVGKVFTFIIIRAPLFGLT